MVNDETERWREMIRDAGRREPVAVVAMTPLRPFPGYSDAVAIDCDDGRRYVVKGRQVQRPLIADHIVGLLGAAIEAPVAEVRLVDVPMDLIVEGSYMADFDSGLGNGSLFIPDCLDSRDVVHEYEDENEERFALLAVLYGWVSANDRQFLYLKSRPHLVYSVDHGHFLAGSTTWNPASLAAAPSPAPDPWIAVQAGCRPKVLHDAVDRLRSVADEFIARSVAAPPDSWEITLDERVSLAGYFAGRRDQLLHSIMRNR